MKDRFIKLTAIILTLSLLTGCASGKKTPAAETMAVSTAAPTPAATAAPTASPTPTPMASAAPERERFYSGHEHADVSFEDMHWELYDMTLFLDRADALAAAASVQEAEELYDWLLNEYVRLRTWNELAWIEFYAKGGADETLADACRQLDKMLTDAGDRLYSGASSALAGQAGDGFADYLGQELAEDLVDYEDMTDRESELLDRETELTLKYNELVDQSNITQTALNRRLGEIYLELVRIRNEIADIHGYDTYAEYAYENTYARDYTPADAARLCEQIKPFARRYYQYSYYSDAFGARMRDFSPEELMDLLREYAPRISQRTAEAQQYMEAHGLYLFESTDIVSEVGFTTLLPWYNAPFLFNGLYGGSYDVTSVFHEFGHYCDAYANPEPDPLDSTGSYDLFEIHSTGLETLMLHWYDEIFGDEADTARIWTLDGLISNVISGCIFDEFQQYVYAHPDMTVDELNRAYSDICASYGMELYSEEYRYYWMRVSHNFESPFYYISYAVSTMASLQLLPLSESDMDAALEIYNRIVDLGAYDKSYEEVLREVGLKLFTEDLDGCVKDAFDELETLCRTYERTRKAA